MASLENDTDCESIVSKSETSMAESLESLVLPSDAPKALYNNVFKDWKDFARQLPIDEEEADILITQLEHKYASNNSLKEVIQGIYKTWRARNGSKATASHLIKTLERMNLKNAAEKVEEELRDTKSRDEDSEMSKSFDKESSEDSVETKLKKTLIDQFRHCTANLQPVQGRHDPRFEDMNDKLLIEQTIKMSGRDWATTQLLKERSENLLITAPSGYGKTTIQKEFAKIWANDEDFQAKMLLLLLIDAEAEGMESKPLAEVLKTQHKLEIEPDSLMKYLEILGPRLTLLVDGSSCVRFGKNSDVESLIKGKILPKARLIVTAQSQAPLQKIGGKREFAICNLLELTEEKQNSYKETFANKSRNKAGFESVMKKAPLAKKIHRKPKFIAIFCAAVEESILTFSDDKGQLQNTENIEFDVMLKTCLVMLQRVNPKLKEKLYKLAFQSINDEEEVFLHKDLNDLFGEDVEIDKMLQSGLMEYCPSTMEANTELYQFADRSISLILAAYHLLLADENLIEKEVQKSSYFLGERKYIFHTEIHGHMQEIFQSACNLLKIPTEKERVTRFLPMVLKIWKEDEHAIKGFVDIRKGPIDPLACLLENTPKHVLMKVKENLPCKIKLDADKTPKIVVKKTLENLPTSSTVWLSIGNEGTQEDNRSGQSPEDHKELGGLCISSRRFVLEIKGNTDFKIDVSNLAKLVEKLKPDEFMLVVTKTNGSHGHLLLQSVVTQVRSNTNLRHLYLFYVTSNDSKQKDDPVTLHLEQLYQEAHNKDHSVTGVFGLNERFVKKLEETHEKFHGEPNPIERKITLKSISETDVENLRDDVIAKWIDEDKV